MSELRRTVSRPTQDGSWLDLLCGLQRTCERFDALLARHVPGEPTDGNASPEVVDALLGLVAIRERLAVHWSTQQRVPSIGARATTITESLLR